MLACPSFVSMTAKYIVLVMNAFSGIDDNLPTSLANKKDLTALWLHTSRKTRRSPLPRICAFAVWITLSSALSLVVDQSVPPWPGSWGSNTLVCEKLRGRLLAYGSPQNTLRKCRKVVATTFQPGIRHLMRYHPDEKCRDALVPSTSPCQPAFA